MYKISKYKSKIILMLVVFLIFGCFLYFSPGKSFIPTENTEQLGTLITQIQKQFSEVYPKSKIALSKGSNSYWVSADGYGVFVPNYISLILSDESSPLDILIREPKLISLSDNVKSTFENAGYTMDTMNTSTSTDDLKFDWFSTAFKSSDGEFLCIIQIGEGYPEWSLQCITKEDFDNSYKTQIPFLAAIGKPKGVIVSPILEGNYASVGITTGNGGDFAIMKKNNGEWTVIYRGQHRPPCKLMIKNNVPLSIYRQCV